MHCSKIFDGKFVHKGTCNIILFHTHMNEIGLYMIIFNQGKYIYFFQDIAILFGAKQNVPVSKDEKEKKNFQSLYESNRKQGLTTTLHRTQSTVFHAGVIGQGLRLSKSGPILPKVIKSY